MLSSPRNEVWRASHVEVHLHLQHIFCMNLWPFQKKEHLRLASMLTISLFCKYLQVQSSQRLEMSIGGILVG